MTTHSDVADEFMRRGFKNVKVEIWADCHPIKGVPLINVCVLGVDDTMPIFWRQDVARVAHRVKWIRRRNGLYAVMKGLGLLGGRGTQRPNAIMRYVGFSDPQMARKEDFFA